MLSTKARVFLLFGVCLLLALGAGGYYIYDSLRVRVVRVAFTSNPALADILSRLLIENGFRIKIEVVQTAGSDQNIQMLQAGDLDIATAQFDMAQGSKVRTVALLEPQYYILVVRNGSGIESPADLRGKRVATSRLGGGSYKSLLWMLSYYHIPTDTVTLRPMEPANFGAVFANNEVDAVFRVTETGDPDVSATLSTDQAHILPLAQVDSMRISRPGLTAMSIPAGAFWPENPAAPARDLPAVGVYTALLANADLEPGVVRTITAMLFEHQNEFAADNPRLVALRAPSREAAFGPAVHLGAQAYFGREEPGFLEKYSAEISFAFTIGPILLSVWYALRTRLQVKQASRINVYYQEIYQALNRLMAAQAYAEAWEVETKLIELLNRYMHDLNQGVVGPGDAQDFSFAWDKAMITVRERLSSLKATQPAM